MIKKLIILFILYTLTLTACSVRDTDVYMSTGNGLNNAFTIGEVKCPKKEAKMYVASYLGYYGSVGGINISDNEQSGGSAFDKVKSSSLALLSRVYSMVLYANNNNIELSKDEIAKVSSAASEFYKMMDAKERGLLEISESDIRSMYENYALACKVYTGLMEGVDKNVSEEEARVMHGYVIYLSSQEKVSELENRIRKGDSFANLAQVYSEKEKDLQVFGKSVYPKEVNERAFNLEEGEESGRIETEDGFYYVQCVVKYDQEQSLANKDIIIKQRQKVLLEQIIQNQNEENYSDLNTEFFDSLKFKDVDISHGSDFFSTIEKYCL